VALAVGQAEAATDEDGVVANHGDGDAAVVGAEEGRDERVDRRRGGARAARGEEQDKESYRSQRRLVAAPYWCRSTRATCTRASVFKQTPFCQLPDTKS